MQVIDIEQNTPEWQEARKGKIGGSRAKDIISKRGGRKIGFYEIIAERLAQEPTDEDPRERGHRLEEEAAKLFEQEYGVELEQVGMWVSDDNSSLYISPDRAVRDDPTTAVEIKCYKTAFHLMAYIEQKLPSIFHEQAMQYFVVNKELERVYFAFHDDRIPTLPFFTIEINRYEHEADIEYQENYLKNALNDIDEIVAKLAF